MLSFAIPGTVIGVSYVMAYNLPPLEITGTAMILIACFVFRNMPVGVRGGIAAMSQLDKSLDEASLTLGASSFRTLRKVVLPLLKPAISAALVYAFVRAITSISAVIFRPAPSTTWRRLYRRAEEWRIRRCHRLLHGADCGDAADHWRVPVAGGRTSPAPRGAPVDVAAPASLR